MRNRVLPKSAKCPLCGGRIAPGTTTFTADLGVGILIVRDVSAQICSQCGEEWFTSEVSHRLDEFAEDMRSKGTEVEILSFKTAGSRSVKV